MCGTTKVDFVRGLGAELVVAHGPGADLPFEDGPQAPYDVVIDIGGARPLRRLRSVLAPRGTLVIVESPFRSLVAPLVRFLEDAAERSGDDVVVVLLPQYQPRHRTNQPMFMRSISSAS